MAEELELRAKFDGFLKELDKLNRQARKASKDVVDSFVKLGNAVDKEELVRNISAVEKRLDELGRSALEAGRRLGDDSGIRKVEAALARGAGAIDAAKVRVRDLGGVYEKVFGDSARAVEKATSRIAKEIREGERNIDRELIERYGKRKIAQSEFYKARVKTLLAANAAEVEAEKAASRQQLVELQSRNRRLEAQLNDHFVRSRAAARKNQFAELAQQKQDHRVQIALLREQLRDRRREIDKYSLSLGSAATALKGFLRSAVLPVTGAAGISAVTRELALFDEKITEAAIATGNAGSAMSVFKRAAADAASTTRFTATEAADALLILARAGNDATASTEQLIPALNLATAAGIGLQESAEVMSTTIKAFGIEAKYAAEVADILAIVSNNTNTDVRGLAEGLKFAAPAASAMGISLADTTSVLGLFANVGLKGSLAGTAFRAVISSLANPSREAEKAIRGMGLGMADVDIEARGLIPVLQTIAERGIGATEAFKIFEQRGTPAILALTQNIPQLQLLSTIIQLQAGYAERAAEVIDNSLNGALKRLKSALSAAVVSAGEQGGLSGALGVFVNTLRTAVTAISFGLGPAVVLLSKSLGGLALLMNIGAEATAKLVGWVARAQSKLYALGEDIPYLGKLFAVLRGAMDRTSDGLKELEKDFESNEVAIVSYLEGLGGGAAASRTLFDELKDILQDLAEAAEVNTDRFDVDLPRAMDNSSKAAKRLRLESDELKKSLQQLGDAEKEAEKSIGDLSKAQDRLAELRTKPILSVEDLNELADLPRTIGQLEDAAKKAESLRQQAANAVTAEQRALLLQADASQQASVALSDLNARLVDGKVTASEYKSAVDQVTSSLAELQSVASGRAPGPTRSADLVSEGGPIRPSDRKGSERRKSPGNPLESTAFELPIDPETGKLGIDAKALRELVRRNVSEEDRKRLQSNPSQALLDEILKRSEAAQTGPATSAPSPQRRSAPVATGSAARLPGDAARIASDLDSLGLLGGLNRDFSPGDPVPVRIAEISGDLSVGGAATGAAGALDALGIESGGTRIEERIIEDTAQFIRDFISGVGEAARSPSLRIDDTTTEIATPGRSAQDAAFDRAAPNARVDRIDGTTSEIVNLNEEAKRFAEEGGKEAELTLQDIATRAKETGRDMSSLLEQLTLAGGDTEDYAKFNDEAAEASAGFSDTITITDKNLREYADGTGVAAEKLREFKRDSEANLSAIEGLREGSRLAADGMVSLRAGFTEASDAVFDVTDSVTDASKAVGESTLKWDENTKTLTNVKEETDATTESTSDLTEAQKGVAKTTGDLLREIVKLEEGMARVRIETENVRRGFKELVEDESLIQKILRIAGALGDDDDGPTGSPTGGAL